MRTIILPGYSIKNKDWAEAVKKDLEPEVPVEVFYWKHWTEPDAPKDWEAESNKVVSLAEGGELNILAKSIGTYVAMMVLARGAKVNKLILCGVPVLDFQKGDDKLYGVLKDFPAENILCIQNENDNHGSFAEVEKFLHSINPEIKIVSKPRDGHEYYYSEDFKQFLSE